MSQNTPRLCGPIQTQGASTFNLRCPACRHAGAFGGLPNIPDASYPSEFGTARVGIRLCPNDDCRRVLFFSLESGNPPIYFPPEIIDFDASRLPERILASLEEATRCHAVAAYKASALMVRRVLEEVCEDQNASGDNLKTRLGNLGTKIVVPSDLLDAADELRLLGNDAAHIEAKLYDDIGEEEARLALELAKELLKAVYQYADLVARLRSLRKPNV